MAAKIDRIETFPMATAGKWIKHFIFLTFVLFLLNGCSAIKMRGTSSLPPTTIPDRVDLSGSIRQQTFELTPFEVSSTDVSGGHHEGLLQVKQPWIWGLSDEQKNTMYSDLANVARYAFINEFSSLGLKVRVTDRAQDASGKPAAIAINGKIAAIEMNTYGHGLSGTFAGFGSAGNYWEAKVAFTDITVTGKSGNLIWSGNLEKYCKLLDSPVKLDWTIFTLMANSLKMSSANLSALGDGIYSSKGEYRLEEVAANPVERAARLAAIDLLRIIDKELKGN
jgi:hypothetical protein